MFSQSWMVPAALVFVGVAASPLPAATIDYTPDSVSDGVTGTLVGGPESTFELYGIGYTQIDTTLYVGLNTNLPIGGAANATVLGGSIAWGDVFFNLSNQPFSEAIAAGQVYGVRFDAANDSPVGQLGLYQVQQTTSVTQVNRGFSSLATYQSVVTQAGGTPSLGDVPLDGSYLSNTDLPQNVMAQGLRLPNQVQFIEDFSTVGLAADFGFGTALAQTGSYTYGFSVDVSGLPMMAFIAHLLAECANDGIAFTGTLVAPEPSTNPETIPEPGAGLALVGVGIIWGLQRFKGIGWG